MRLSSGIWPVMLILLTGITAFSDTTEILTLDQAVNLAKKNSDSLKAAHSEVQAAELNAESVNSSRFPRLSLDGNYHTLSVVPEVNIGTSALKMTDDHSYSIGPTITYTLWDSGLRKNAALSAEHMAQFKKQQFALSESQLKLQTQVTYIQSALAQELYDLTRQASELSLNQNRDIHNRLRSGSVSRIESLNSDTDVANYRLQVEKSRSDLNTALTELQYLTQKKTQLTAKLQSLNQIMKQTPKDLNAVTVSDTHPLIQAQTQMEKTSRAQADSQKSQNFPVLNLQLRSSLDYPNGPKFVQINQNSVGVTLSWSLFEFGATQKQISARLAEAEAAQNQVQNQKKNLQRDLEKALLKITSLNEQMKDAKIIVEKQQDLAKLKYSAFKFGKLSYSEVETANLRWLDARRNLTALKAQYLTQVFNIQFLTESSSR